MLAVFNYLLSSKTVTWILTRRGHDDTCRTLCEKESLLGSDL